MPTLLVRPLPTLALALVGLRSAASDRVPSPSSSVNTAGGREPPNVLFIMADDLGVGEPSFTHPGLLSTPNLDELAASGMRFTAAYAGYTVCAPSRATLFTGRNSGHLHGAPADWPLLPALLQRAGYETMLFGKSAPMDDDVHGQSPRGPLVWGMPTRHGFDHFVGQPNQLYCHNMYPTHWTVGEREETLPLNMKNNRTRDACMSDPSAYNYTTDLFADAAISWLRAKRGRDEARRSDANAEPPKPFFAYLSFTVPHAGGWSGGVEAPEQGQPVPTDMGYGARTDWPVVERDHAASVSYLDLKLGEVLAALKSSGLDETTAVFFASDNGAHDEGGHDVRFFNSSGGLRGFKRSFYEGGVRSPSLVRWPGVTAAGSVSHVPWAFWDVLPTLVDMAHATLPAGAAIDGRSIVPTLRGEAQPEPDYLYWTWRGAVAEGDSDAPTASDGDEPRRGAAPPGYAVRVGSWKAVVHACANATSLTPSMDDVMELYDLSKDPAEATNVAGAHPDVLTRIKALLVQKGLSCTCYQCGRWRFHDG